ncbi:MAG TPA: serine/threonine-protein kinase, partial [Planctomycetaceae bacterium]|nr:serine/threonine-protein kinase [Planctomycetaceae bacterium]
MSDERDAIPQRRLSPLTQRRLFLSCVSHEFRGYRDVLSANLAQPGVELRRQEDFVNAGQSTLEKLHEYIRTCDAVIHLIGSATGAYPPAVAVDALLKSIPDFVSKLGLEDLIKSPGLSYTQWEAWLGLYYDKKVAVYLAIDKTQREAGFTPDSVQRKRQELHWDRLKRRGSDREEFVSPNDLSIEVLRSMPLLVPGFVENVKRGEFRDRNLLFAVLAMEDDILSREAFVRVCKLWKEESCQSIADLMQQEGLLTPEDRALVEARLDRKLKNRGGDIRQSLAESLGSDARQSLCESLDPDTIASLPDRLAGFSGLLSPSGQWRYKLTRTHGIGGLGVVSVADDAALERSVAVKQLKPERLLDPMAVERFIREARITGRLQHPNIVPVYELGLTPDDQIPFYAMRFVGHRTLHDAITEHYSDKAASASDRNLRFRDLIQSFLAVCNAVAFAHEQRVIHRDIKPANIMIGEFGEVILLDWGLAKRTDEAEPAPLADAPDEVASSNDAAKTKAGVKLGSPAYMAPEQAAAQNDQHGPHTDIYGLGVTLYEVLTGDVPFTGTSTEELLDAIRFRALPDPRDRNPAVPRALAAICRKAMEKKPADRYATAKLLADDIQHWLADEPVSAFAEPITLRIQRVTRKNPGPVSALAATILVGIVGLSGSLYFVNAEKIQKETALKEKGIALEKMEVALTDADSQRKKANENADEAKLHLRNAEQRLAQIHFERGLTQEREGLHRSSLAQFYLAATTIPKEASVKGGYRDVLFDRLVRSLPPLQHDAAISCVAFSPDGTRVVTGSGDNTARLWEAQTGAPVGAVMKHEGIVWSVAFSPDGTRVVTGSGDNTARLWEAQTGAPLGAVINHEGYVTSVAFSPDGTRVVTGSWDKTARLWDAQTGVPVGVVMKHEGSVDSVAFSPDGTRLVTGSWDNTARLWDAQTGAPLGAVMNHEGYVRSVAFSPDGTRVVTGSGDTARLWDAQTGAPLGAVMKHEGDVWSVAFSPDGTRVVTSCADTARLWEAQTGVPVGVVMKHKDIVGS